ncbi:LOW QUALITY PROTEIN: hypothetical protein OSB04_013573, partial [Centaurea solstitialis]
MTKSSTLIRISLLLSITLDLFFPQITASSFDHHRYNVGDNVPLFANIVGPLNNPSETYQYYDLPFCTPEQVIPKKATLGEALNGVRLTNTLYTLNFRQDKVGETLCNKKLKRDDLKTFRNAITNDFYFQMYYDDLPLWGFTGKMEEENWTGDGNGPKYYVFKHVQFDALYNDDRIIEIRAFSDPNHAVDITEETEIDVKFTYSISWNATSNGFENRMNKYSRASVSPAQRQIHWFSFGNGVVVIVLLVGLLTMMFMRHLKNDLRKYNGDEEQDKEVGWKYVHSDVFRCPKEWRCFVRVVSYSFWRFSGFYILRSWDNLDFSCGVVCSYGPVAGYSAASFFGNFLRLDGYFFFLARGRIPTCVFLSGVLFVGPLSVTVLLLNTMAVSIGATTALPFGTGDRTCVHFNCLPLLAFGGVMGYRFRSKFQAPSATKISPREIPLLAWHRKTLGQMFIAGLLPFSAIVLELHNLYATIWSYKVLTLPGVLFITFVLLVEITSLLSVGLTYIQLTIEDHRWWWRCVWRGGSVAIFMFGYCIYYYCSRSNMKGLCNHRSISATIFYFATLLPDARYNQFPFILDLCATYLRCREKRMNFFIQTASIYIPHDLV